MPDPAAHPDNWAAQGLCRDKDPDRQFPDSEFHGPDLQLAKRTCAHCPVRVACLETAVSNGERFGVWGGLSTTERKAHTAGAPILTCDRCKLRYASTRSGGLCHACRDAVRQQLARLDRNAQAVAA